MDLIRSAFIAVYSLTKWRNIVRLMHIGFHSLRRYSRKVLICILSIFDPFHCSKETLKTGRNHFETTSFGLFLTDLLGQNDKWWKTRLLYLDPYCTFEEWMIGEIYGRGIVKVKYVGSYRETINSIHYSNTSSDIDIMYIYKMIKVRNLQGKNKSLLKTPDLLIEDSSAPGYVYLRIPGTRDSFVNAFLRAVSGGEFDKSLHVDAIIDYLKEIAITDMNGVSYLSSYGFQVMHEKFNRQRFSGWLQFRQEGPASNVKWNVSGLPQIIKVSPLDMVFAFHCSDWPSQAAEWPHRERCYYWPAKDVISSIVSYGVDLVAKGSQNHSTQLVKKRQFSKLECEWRLSFSVAELLLVGQWNETQKLCYRLVKSLRYDFLERHTVKSYYLKNVMLWLIEETPVEIWQHQRLVQCTILLLDRLKSCCAKRRCPHYLMKNYNFFSFYTPLELASAERNCTDLVSSLYSYVWVSDGLWYEIERSGLASYYSAVKKDFEQILQYHWKAQQVLSDIESAHGQIFRLYYCSKIHKEVAKYMHNSLLKLHYSPTHVFAALWAFLKQNSLSADSSKEFELLYSQVFLSLMKGWRWFQKQTAHTESTLLPFDEQELISALGGLGPGHRHAIVVYDYLMQDKLFEAMREVKAEMEHRYNSRFSLTDFLNKVKENRMSILTSFPFFISELDLMPHKMNWPCFEVHEYSKFLPFDLLIICIVVAKGKLSAECEEFIKDLMRSEHFSGFAKLFRGHRYFERFDFILTSLCKDLEKRLLEELSVKKITAEKASMAHQGLYPG